MIKTKIMVVTHKMSNMPSNNNLYIPTIVGPSKNSLNFTNFYRDDEGENIAEKNQNYCELTALFWAWKNLDVDYIGLTHYRRAFMSSINKDSLPDEQELNDIFSRVDVILPNRRNYFIESTWDHYKHNHFENDLIEVKNLITNEYPSYLNSFNQVMKEKKSHRFNMFIMKKDLLNDYCEWLFDILLKLEQKVDISEYDPYQSRIFGFISERLLDVWILNNSIEYEELACKYLEKQNWLTKGGKFVYKKILGGKKK